IKIQWDIMRAKRVGFFSILLLFLIQTVSAQNKTVTGKVVDGNGIPLPGVNIIVSGTNKGTTTDFDGDYSIIVDEGKVLVFSSMGFTEQKITVKSRNIINITLEEGLALDEVFVVAYGT